MVATNPKALTYSIEKTGQGFIGQCLNVEAIIVEAESENMLKDEMLVAATGYFKACPEAKQTLINALDKYSNLKNVPGFGELLIDIS